MIDLSVLVTESRNKETMGLDQMTPLEIVTVMNREDGKAVEAVGEVLPQIAQCHCLVYETSLETKGRIVYIGAGTSTEGWEVLDAVECPPTFGSVTLRTWWWARMAGGTPAFVRGSGGARGQPDHGGGRLRKEIHLSPADIVIGLAASGRTPYADARPPGMPKGLDAEQWPCPATVILR
ncbi:MAG: hypothetical protein ACLTW9_12705 [Enterocloster sp.]